MEASAATTDPAETAERLTPANLPESLRKALGADRSAEWQRDRAPYNPQVWRLDTGTGTAAALTSSRPNTRYTKLVDLWSDAATATTDGPARALLEQIIATSAAGGDACLGLRPAAAADRVVCEE